ncbi:drug/metabolite transporter (DMT)-like permease [Microbacterium endophyticum]|uniref:Drug/metabolite transporter (DMT)-like permease n=1 Tax=Microbacterium endophyticum TaxID=1526412 RepID=A0A7W4V1P4_9MICO|nr:drug/metabolite transporter (DMT)-like permease [Microbacterium endophyticum]
MFWFSPTLDDVSNQLVGVFENPALLLGIPLALSGAVFMSFGAQYQHRGVTKVGQLAGGANSNGLTLSQLGRLLTRPSWVLGTVMLGLAIVCQLGALSVAPLIVVQPLGAISLVITTLLNARVTGHTPTRRSITAIIACVGGIFLFVTVAALFAVEQAVTTSQIVIVLLLLLVISIVLVLLWLLFRRRQARALFYVVAAGIVYGFVATLAKIVILRVQDGNFDWLTLLSLVALVAGTGLGAYFVQTAYSSGPPDLAIAGLTVVDPMVAVLVGLTVLGEGSAVPFWGYVIFIIAGAVAIWGVINLAIYHPQVMKDSQELNIRRGSGELRQPDETE